MSLTFVLIFVLILLFCQGLSEKTYRSGESSCARSYQIQMCDNNGSSSVHYNLNLPASTHYSVSIKFSLKLEMVQEIDTAPKCFMAPKDIFSRRTRLAQVDDYLHRTKSIVLDFYEWYKTDIERVMNVKNRHQMVLKVLIEHFNRSLSSCGPSQFSQNAEEYEIDFSTITSLEMLFKFKTFELFHSREICKIGFSAVRRQDSFLVLVALVKPIGWRIFLTTAILIPLLTMGAFAHQKISEKFVGLYNKQRRVPSKKKFFGLLVRAHIDQCVENRQTDLIVGRNMNLRILYMSWLFYCLLVVTTFKSNLIQELMQPEATVSAETFEELLADPRPFVGFDGESGQPYEIWRVLAREAIMHVNRDDNIFQQLSKRYKKRGLNTVDDILEGRFNLFDEVNILHRMFQILERKYGIYHYKIAKTFFTNDVFWAVKRVRHSKFLATLEHLASSGIIDYFR